MSRALLRNICTSRKTEKGQENKKNTQKKRTKVAADLGSVSAMNTTLECFTLVGCGVQCIYTVSFNLTREANLLIWK